MDKALISKHEKGPIRTKRGDGKAARKKGVSIATKDYSQSI